MGRIGPTGPVGRIDVGKIDVATGPVGRIEDAPHFTPSLNAPLIFGPYGQLANAFLSSVD